MNARAIATAGAARMILDRELTAERLLSVLAELLSEDAKLRRMAKAAKKLGRPKAADEIVVGEVLRFMEGGLAPVACLEEGGAQCPRASACRTLAFWRGLDETIRRYTDSFTVADLMRADNAGFDYII